MHVLHEGYAREEADGDRVTSTVTLIIDAGRVIVVDPGWWPTPPHCWPRWPRTGRAPAT